MKTAFVLVLMVLAIATSASRALHPAPLLLVSIQAACVLALAILGRAIATPSAIRGRRGSTPFDLQGKIHSEDDAAVTPIESVGEPDVVVQEGLAPANVAAPPIDNALTRVASARGWNVLHANAIVGEIRSALGGMRIAAEHDAMGAGCTYVDADAHHLDDAALSALRVSVSERVPRARVVVAGSILRIEIPGAAIDSQELDDTLDAVERSVQTRGGAYR